MQPLHHGVELASLSGSLTLAGRGDKETQMAVCNRTIVSILVYLDFGLWRERWKRMHFQYDVQGSSGVMVKKIVLLWISRRAPH